jgi:hypothetical protein
VQKVLQKRGYTPQNTNYAQSVCPEEVNHGKGDITSLFAGYLGNLFNLGGLAGMPFTGRTGFAAFSNNVPDDGHCFVLMAPHIGLDPENDFGKFSRDSHSSSVACCSAIAGALEHCTSGQPPADILDHPEDYQLNFIINQVDRVKDIILGGRDIEENTIQADLATQMHRIAKKMLDQIVNVNFGGKDSTLVVLTGIQINMSNPFDNFFQPRSFYVLQKDTKKVDLFRETFG